MVEIWKSVIGADDLYEVSSLGAVRRVSKQSKLKPFLTKGYPTVSLSIAGSVRKQKVHRLVCIAFHGAAPTLKHQVNHKDGNKENNEAINLEWCTQQYNSFHCVHVLKKNSGTKHYAFGRRGVLSANAAKYIAESPDGIKVIIIGIRDFCRLNKMQSTRIYEVLNGHYPSYRGWKFKHFEAH